MNRASGDQPCLSSRIYALPPSGKILQNILGDALPLEMPPSTFYIWEMPQMHDGQFLRGPAGGLDFEKSRFSVFKGPCGRLNISYLLGFEPHEYARTLSFEKSYPMH